MHLIMAPSNLGLRPLVANQQPGAWRAPKALKAAGLADAIGASRTIQMDRPSYRFDEEAGTRIRNGHAIRAFSELLGAQVAGVLRSGAFPLVVGGDCSIMLGGLLGGRSIGKIGLLHVDGHSDFYHPGNYDSEGRLGSAAGMDLALATGRGEPLLAPWNGEALVEDRFVIQIGEREKLRPDADYGDILRTQVRRFPVRGVLKRGIAETVRGALSPVDGERRPMWLHIDLDVLDQRVMPAVDSPGSPGLTFSQLADLISGLVGERRVIGADIAIFDPELDPRGTYARDIVACMARGFAGLKAAI
ncbi:arginase family protein [Sphingosinicella sp. BN140058]|nr:arginase family protein [Sphingosinicella sp. BN140058]